MRASGVNYDVRKAYPYLVYDKIDFDDPLGTKGDNYDRFVCRTQEIEQSMRIVEQALLLMEMNYVHLPMKRAIHAIDPIQQLKELVARTEMAVTP